LDVVERAAMEQALAEHATEPNECAGDACAARMGRLVGATRVVAGTFGREGGGFVLTVRLVDCATGRALWSARATGRNEEELGAAVPDLASRLSSRLLGTLFNN
ncbi:MAG: hypothetical protein AAB368_12305, partial [bacterium]